MGETLLESLRYVAVALLAATLAPTAAAQEHDLHYLAEHVLESGMDAHYEALPWPASEVRRGAWQTSVDVSTAHTRTKFIDLDGPMLAFAAARGTSTRWGYELLGFYGDKRISGSTGDLPLSAGFLQGVPLELPQPAAFTNPRGTLRQYGIGAAFVRPLGNSAVRHSAQLTAGLLVERFVVADFALDYRLLAGADAGALGVIDHSNSARFFTPFVGWQQTRRLASRWTWSPRAMLICPLPPKDFNARLTGPGFDIAARSPDASSNLGDPFVTVGLALAHEPSGLELDLGGLLLFPVAELASHPGVDQSMVLHFTWRSGERSR